MQRNMSKFVAFQQQQIAEVGLADAGGVRQNGVEYRLQLTRRRLIT